MITQFLWVTAVLLLPAANSQELAGNSIGESLLICYNTTEIRERIYRFPSTVNMVIDLIRAAEDGKSTQDARVMAISLLHRFRQDGIVAIQTDNNEILPYSPTGMQTYKNVFLLKELIPGNNNMFPNETLTTKELCNLHFLISNTVELFKRGDEIGVCNKIGAYTRRIREIENFETNTETEKPIDPTNTDSEPVPRYNTGTGKLELSDCPIEGGVVQNKYGNVQIGTVLAGIAAGLEQQNIPKDDSFLDNRFGVTLAGDISEVATQQSTFNTQIVGAKGDWNNTLAPQMYFINTNTKFQMTDAEIRAGLDGFVIAMNMQNWKNKFSNIKVSQILDMYYSGRWVMDQKFRACNRDRLREEFVVADDLKNQSYVFTKLYDNYARYGTTLTPKLMSDYSSKAVNNYMGTRLSDPSCPSSTEKVQRPATQLTIIFDGNWEYKNLHSVVSYIIDKMEINKYNSNYTVISAGDGEVRVNSTYRLSKFFENYNISVHDRVPSGFSPSLTMDAAEAQIIDSFRFEDRSANSVPRSSIVLFVMSKEPDSTTTSRVQSSKSKLDLYETKFMVLGVGSNKDAYTSMASSSSNVFLLTIESDSNMINQINPLITRISEIPRSMRNTRCTNGGESENNPQGIVWNLSVEPGAIDFYKLSDLYFYDDGESTKSQFKLRTTSDSVTLCYSRSETRPMSNASSSTCQDVNTSEFVIDLGGCTDSCSPLYFSVEAKAEDTGSRSARCTDTYCRFPDNIKFTVTGDNFVCQRSAAINIISNIVSLFAALIFTVYLL